MEIIALESTGSTNSWAAANEDNLPSTAFIFSREQIAGRGQRGNSWESEPGKNITASVIFHPENFEAKDQFAISEAVALAIMSFLKDYGVDTRVKWPNDIYAGDKKICGVLVENRICERYLQRCIAGFGININQKEFHSDAPNPVSLWQLKGVEYDLSELIPVLAAKIERYLGKLDERESLHSEFIQNLWRKDGAFHRFYDHKLNEVIKARIENVASNGLLTLCLANGERRDYAFKEIEFLL